MTSYKIFPLHSYSLLHKQLVSFCIIIFTREIRYPSVGDPAMKYTTGVSGVVIFVVFVYFISRSSYFYSLPHFFFCAYLLGSDKVNIVRSSWRLEPSGIFHDAKAINSPCGHVDTCTLQSSEDHEEN